MGNRDGGRVVAVPYDDDAFETDDPAQEYVWCSIDDVLSQEAVDGKVGPLRFISRHCRTNAPNQRVEPIPLWPHIVEFVQAIHSGDDVHAEKTRQMTASWAACAWFLWALTFYRNFPMFMVSRKERLVDDGGENSSPASLMGKVRFMWARLPESLRRRVVWTHLKATCTGNGSYIVGESANPNLGRGLTVARALRDESAFIPQSMTCAAAMRAACPRGIVDVSTPNGPDGHFYWMKRNKARLNHVRWVSMHWTKHPERTKDLEWVDGKPTSSWYRKETETLTQDQVAREYDISYEHSVAGLVYPEFSIQSHVRSDLAYDPTLPLWVGMDFGIGAPTAAVFFQRHGDECWVLAEYEQAGQGVKVHAKELESIAWQLGFRGTRRDLRMAGDPAGNAREIARGSSVINEYATEGYGAFETPRHPVKDGIRLVGRLLHNRRLFVSDDMPTRRGQQAELLVTRFSGYSYPTDDESNIKKDEPIHDEHSHLMDALRYGVLATFPLDLPIHTLQADDIAATFDVLDGFEGEDPEPWRPITRIRRW